MLYIGGLNERLLWAVWTTRGTGMDMVISSSYEFVRNFLGDDYVAISQSQVPFPKQIDPCQVSSFYKGEKDLSEMFKQGKNVLRYLVDNHVFKQGEKMVPFVFGYGLEELLNPRVIFDMEKKTLSCKVGSVKYTQYYNFATCKLKKKTKIVIDDLDRLD
jgi:hypothetical protein